MKQILPIFLFFIYYNISTAQNTSINWKSDLELLKEELPNKHIDLFFSISENEFNSELDRLIEELPTLSTYEITDRLLQLIAKIGDSHTNVGFGKLNNPNKLLPFSLYPFSDGLYVLYAKPGYEFLLGKKVLEINNYGIEQIIDSLSTLIAVDNRSTIKNRVPSMICFAPHLEYFGFSNKKEYKIKISDANGQESIIRFGDTALVKNKWVNYKPNPMSYCWRNRREHFTENYYNMDSIYYIQYNICRSKEMEQRWGDRKKAKKLPSFTEFENKVFNTIEERPVKKLIFDLRFNGGGTSNQGTEFVNKLKEYEKVNQKGKLFVVISRHTFSSGLVNAMDFKNLTNAIFVGEESSGKPNHYGDVRQLTLPSSGLTVSYSTKYFKYSDDNTNSLKPDIEIETNFNNYNNGIDPVFEYIKSLNKNNGS